MLNKFTLFRSAAVAVAAASSIAQASVEPLTLTSEDKWPAARWMYGVGEMPKGTSATALMAASRRAELDNENEICVKRAEEALPKTKTLQPWIALTMLDCALKAKTKDNAKDHASLTYRALTPIEKNPTWLLKGAHASLLRSATIRGYVSTLEADIKSNRTRAAQTIERVQDLIGVGSGFGDEKTRAMLWRQAGELAFAQQKNEVAREYFKRSLAEVDDAATKARLASVDTLINDKEAAKDREPRAQTQALESTKEELELVDRVTSELKSGDLVNAVEDAIKIIRNYPGGSRAKWATERVTEAYVSISDKTDSKSVASRSQMIKQMEKADGDRLAEWARLLYNRGQWEDSMTLAKKAVESVGGARSSQILDTASKAAIATDRFDYARELFDRLVKEHAGTPPAREALFRSGLLWYRQGEWAKASTDFERLVNIPAVGQLEMPSRYWLWRSFQKLKSDRANEVADELMNRAPFSYYGLRARYERAGNVLEFKSEPTKLSVKLWLTENERLSYDRALELMKAGWLEEAQLELRDLPAPQKPEDKAIRSLIWAAAGQYQNASKLANDAWDEKSELRRAPFVNVAFPAEFLAIIETQANARKLDRYLVRSLIKQESSYNPRAVSSANALGLMQMLSSTAKEMATDLKLGALNYPDDMFQPARNIQMGTYYLARLMNRYQSSVPLALAAYNAGPARIDRWLKTRPSLKNVATTRTSAADEEIWLDELPYSETSLYVKSILRNMLIYRMLDEGRVQVPDPLWVHSG